MNPSFRRLIVFSDDWGRHPSSCQHLVRHLPTLFDDVTWVNTIGTRLPSLSRDDISKVFGKLKSWWQLRDSQDIADQAKHRPNVLNPRMYPGFRARWQRQWNARWISSAIHECLGPRQPDEQRVALTTIPVTADLLAVEGNSFSTLDVDRWVYYCVDDFGVWPGLDADVMQSLERLQLQRVDRVVAASDALASRLQKIEPASAPFVLTHGIDPDHWSAVPEQRVCPALALLPRPLFMFWGLLDRRLNTEWCQRLCESIDAKRGSFVCLGPQQNIDPVLTQLKSFHTLGPQPYDELPRFAHQADVLVMPYANLPVTQQMQPLKFKEYLASGKPVVATRLPSNAGFSTSCDLVEDVNKFVERCWLRAEFGATVTQLAHRDDALAEETWTHKADLLLGVISEALASKREAVGR